MSGLSKGSRQVEVPASFDSAILPGFPMPSARAPYYVRSFSNELFRPAEGGLHKIKVHALLSLRKRAYSTDRSAIVKADRPYPFSLRCHVPPAVKVPPNGAELISPGNDGNRTRKILIFTRTDNEYVDIMKEGCRKYKGSCERYYDRT